MINARCGDCLKLMSLIADASIDCVLCDPPYGKTRNKWDSVIAFEPMWDQLKRIVKPGGAIIFTASQPFSSALVMSNPDWFRHEWVWHKNKASGHLNAKLAPMKAHETILVFCNKTPLYQPQMTVGHDAVNAYYTANNGSNYGAGKMMSGGGSTQRYPRTVQSFNVVNNDDPEKIHPTQKPVDMLEYLLLTYSRPGDTVLDFAMGSGSTGIACRNTKRNFIGFESDAEIFTNAYLRLHGG